MGLLVALALAVGLLASGASADVGATGTFGAGSGVGAGHLNTPTGMARDSAGNRYVADPNNHRVDEFDSSGAFVRAWGWGIKDGTAALQTCTTTCVSGPGGTGLPGQLAVPTGVAVDASNHVFVVDGYFAGPRVSEYDVSGADVSFIRAWGWGVVDGMSHLETCTTTCQDGIAGTGAGQFKSPEGAAVDGSGNVFVADGNRISEFNTSAATISFDRAWGIGVATGGTGFETCTSSCAQGFVSGSAGGLNQPNGIALDGSGDIYAAEQLNRRVSEFDVSGSQTGNATFVRAFGWGVDTGADAFQTCTTGSTCQFGSDGGGAGQLSTPGGLALANGNAYVAEIGNHRVSQFSLSPSSVSFTRAWGWGVRTGSSGLETCTTSCRTGIAGTGCGQLDQPNGIVADGSGNVSVVDESNNRGIVFADSTTCALSATALSSSASSGSLGASIHDTATLSGGTSPTGAITFKAYGPDDTNCSGPVVFGSAPVTVNGNGIYTSPDFTPAAAGSYRWTVDYSGDGSNSLASSGCNAANETSAVSAPNPAEVPPPAGATAPATGQRAAALKKCKHKHGRARSKCKKKANLLPV
jgi:hypothetical protein